MKHLITIILFFTAITFSFAQQEATTLSYNNFETDFFTYKPVQKKHVTDDHFSFAEYVISETKKALNNNVDNYSVIHYWNIITALDMLKEDESALILAFQKLAVLPGNCKYIINYKNKVTFYETISSMYDHYYEECKKNNSLAAKTN